MKFGLQTQDPQPTVADLDLTSAEVVDLLSNFFETSPALNQGALFKMFHVEFILFCRKIMTYSQET